MVAVECRRVEATVGFDWPAILAKFNDILSHDRLPDLLATKAFAFSPPRREPQSPNWPAVPGYRRFQGVARRHRAAGPPPALSAISVYALTGYIPDQSSREPHLDD
jgi:hypothetical protein